MHLTIYVNCQHSVQTPKVVRPSFCEVKSKCSIFDAVYNVKSYSVSTRLSVVCLTHVRQNRYIPILINPGVCTECIMAHSTSYFYFLLFHFIFCFMQWCVGLFLCLCLNTSNVDAGGALKLLLCWSVAHTIDGYKDERTKESSTLWITCTHFITISF